MMPWWPRPAVPAGMRVYAVGPLDGRLAALDDALARIAADHRPRAPAERRILLLGGLADGPDAPALMLRGMRLCAEDEGVAVLRGPAEEALLAGAAGGWPSADDVPATVLHWLARRPREGWIGDYRFGDGRVTARGRAVAGDVIALEGTKRRPV